MAGPGRRRPLLIVAVLALIVVIGLAFAQDQETLHVRSGVAADDPRAATYLGALIGVPVTHGNKYEVLTNGDEIFPAMLEAIDGAQRRVSFETYVYEEGKAADLFTGALERAAQRGVTVRVVVDLIGAAGMDDAHVDRLERAGAMVLTLNAPRWYELEEVNYRTHRKILVVDGEVGFSGGVGVADYWMGNAGVGPEWRDTQVRMRGPVARLLEGAFYENFIEAGATIAPELGDDPPTFAQDGRSLVVRSAPTGGSNDMKRLYLFTIAMARRSIDIASPYFVTDESTLWSLEDAVKRGVKIRILVESDITDAKPVKYASREAYDRLLSLGIEIYEYQPTMMHAKVMVVDGAWSMFGSANFDNRSLELNDELNIAVASRELAAEFTDDFEADLRRATRLELTEWRRRSVLEKMREHFWSYFGEIF
jgi:cardiolipin synthase